MAGRKVMMERDSPRASTSFGVSDAAGKKGPRKILVPAKKKNLMIKKESSVGNGNTPLKKTAKFRKDSVTTPKKRNVTNNDGPQSDSSDDEPREVNFEDLYKVIYVEDFCDAVNLVPDDASRHISSLMDMDSDRLQLLDIVENEMTKLLNELDVCGATGASSGVKNNLKDLLIQISQIDDQRVQTTDEIAEIFEEKLRLLRIDLSNLDAEVAKHDPDTPTIPKSSKSMKKPSINPTHYRTNRGTPTKLNLVGDNGDHGKLAYPTSASATCSDLPAPPSPTPSYCCTSSFDINSGRDSQPTVQDLEDDSRYRACKFKNPPLYVFSARYPTSNAGSPNKTEAIPKFTRKEVSEDNNDEVDANTVNKEKVRRRSQSGSQGSKGSKRERETPENTSASDPSDSDSDDSSPEPTYCLCEKISHGKMVQCDNELCPFEWFHFKCINLKKIPKGDWFCPKCRGENSSVMKPKQQFLKELEQYNKEKEKESMKLQKKERI